jgi:hypothetical protein
MAVMEDLSTNGTVVNGVINTWIGTTSLNYMLSMKKSPVFPLKYLRLDALRAMQGVPGFRSI